MCHVQLTGHKRGLSAMAWRQHHTYNSHNNSNGNSNSNSSSSTSEYSATTAAAATESTNAYSRHYQHDYEYGRHEYGRLHAGEYADQEQPRLATGSMAGDVCVWDLRAGNKPVKEIMAHDSAVVELYWDGINYLLTCSWDGTVKKFDLRYARGDVLQYVISTGSGGGGGESALRELAVEYDDNGRVTRACACDLTHVMGYDIAGASNPRTNSGVEIQPSFRIPAHSEKVSACKMTPTGFVSCCEGGLVKVWSFAEPTIGSFM